MEFDRYKVGAHKVHNKYGIGFTVVFGRAHRDDESRYMAFLSALKSTENSQCLCDEDGEPHEIDDEGFCRMSYNEMQCCHIMTKTFKECLESTRREINKYKRCSDCSQLHCTYKKFNRCQDCDLQSFMDEKIKSLGECVCCTSSMYFRNSTTLNCGHTFHKKCIKRISNSRCPLCRGDVKVPTTTE